MHQFCFVEFFANSYSFSWASWVVPSTTSHVESESSSDPWVTQPAQFQEHVSSAETRWILQVQHKKLHQTTPRRLRNQKYWCHSIHKNVHTRLVDLYVEDVRLCCSANRRNDKSRYCHHNHVRKGAPEAWLYILLSSCQVKLIQGILEKLATYLVISYARTSSLYNIATPHAPSP